MPPAPSLEAQSHPPTVGRCPRASILTLRQSDDPQRIIHQKMALISILIFRVNNRVNFARRIAIREWPLRIRWIKQEQVPRYSFHFTTRKIHSTVARSESQSGFKSSSSNACKRQFGLISNVLFKYSLADSKFPSWQK